MASLVLLLHQKLRPRKNMPQCLATDSSALLPDYKYPTDFTEGKNSKHNTAAYV